MIMLQAGPAPAQMQGLHGDQNFCYDGLYSGNQIKVSFYNDGMIGTRLNNPEDFGGEWPINSGHVYINQIIVFVGAEVKDANGEFKHIVSEGNGIVTGDPNQTWGQASGDAGPNGDWWTWCPLPGFANDERKRIAMSQWPWSWPAEWPDKFEDMVDPGWPDQWNGYFGKDVLNADQESYYVMDDYNNREFSFYPDSTDPERRGLGLRGTVRGFQWSNVLVEDILFGLYDIKNIGTTSHDKMNFGIMSGPIMGNAVSGGGDGDDDGGEYDLAEELGYHLDKDDVGAGGWSPVGFHGLAFFESPGNPYDGIDNDGDAVTGSGRIIDEAMFAPRIVGVNEPVVVIDYLTFDRRIVPMPAEGISITYQEKTYSFLPGRELAEIENNLIDDNLNGIIDENNGSVFGEGKDAVQRYLYLGLKYRDWMTGEGSDNILIDEKRDDGIDNDGDWDVKFDDVGMDGVPNTGDPGENDGRATSGRGTDLPGEPHIDKTDIDESDMIGLTAFNIYTPWTIYPLSADETLWEAIQPGYLNARGQFGDTDILLGSGYFPLKPGQIERFSIGILFGIDKEDLIKNKGYAKKTYDENYNFAKAPYVPAVTAVPGDNRVTLYWDDTAEKSVDPISGMDFEGYRIYRSTDPAFSDMRPITDMYGSVSYRKPLAQFDLVNEYKGSAAVPVNGIHFDLGNNTGLQHIWTDSTAVNGFDYYYAVTSYDHGDPNLGIAPTECSKYISITKDGKIDKGKNVAIVRPEAPSAGYAAAEASGGHWLEGSTNTGAVRVQIIDPDAVAGGSYRLVFGDTVRQLANGYYPETRHFTLLDMTSPGSADTLINRQAMPGPDVESPVLAGFRLILENEPGVALDTLQSGWNHAGIYGYIFTPYKYTKTLGLAKASDYRIEFGDLGAAESAAYEYTPGKILPAVPVNFKVINASEGREIAFAFWSKDGSDGFFTGFTEKPRSDLIVFLEEDSAGAWAETWSFAITSVGSDSATLNPAAGDAIDLKVKKPFLSNDVFVFETKPPATDANRAAAALKNIKVVPNPYIVTHVWEPLNPYTNGRGPRELHFTHLPPVCTIQIFNIRGQLIDKIVHHAPSLADGTEIWDMQTKDQLDIAYGIYIYHVDAGAIGQITGKFAVIK
jgi:hypothetical protein